MCVAPVAEYYCYVVVERVLSVLCLRCFVLKCCGVLCWVVVCCSVLSLWFWFVLLWCALICVGVVLLRFVCCAGLC